MSSIYMRMLIKSRYRWKWRYTNKGMWVPWKWHGGWSDTL